MKFTAPLCLRKWREYKQHHDSNPITRTTNLRKIIFKEELPLKLRNKVTGKGSPKLFENCTQEMYNMMSCLKANDYAQSECTKEIKLFSDCSKRLAAKEEEMKKLDKELHITGYKLNKDQLNEYMKKFSPKSRK